MDKELLNGLTISQLVQLAAVATLFWKVYAGGREEERERSRVNERLALLEQRYQDRENHINLEFDEIKRQLEALFCKLEHMSERLHEALLVFQRRSSGDG